MRNLSDIHDDLTQNTENISKIQEKADAVKVQLSRLQADFAVKILSDLPDDEKLEIRRAVSELKFEHDAHVDALNLLKDKEDALEAEKTTRLLYDADAVRYSKNLEDAELLSKSIRDRAASMQKLASELVADITGLFSSVQNGCSSLGTVAAKLPADIAMEPFLTGEMISTEGENRPLFMNGAGERFQGLVGSLKFEPERESLEVLRDTFERLESFRRSVIAFQSGYDLIRSPRNLVNSRRAGKKVPGTTRNTYLFDEAPQVQIFEP